MKCPQCDSEMSEGNAFVKGTLDFLGTIGFNLVFKKPGKFRAKTVLKKNVKRHSLMCDNCGALLICSVNK